MVVLATESPCAQICEHRSRHGCPKSFDVFTKMSRHTPASDDSKEYIWKGYICTRRVAVFVISKYFAWLKRLNRNN